MNKKRVNDWIPVAKQALMKFEIADKNGKIIKTYRGQISTFGAAVTMGSLPAAVAFFSEKNKSTVERDKLIKAAYYCITEEEASAEDILDKVCRNPNEYREKFIDASIALKLAMNFFELVKE